MEWMVKCRSKPGTGELRERTLPAHQRYLDTFAAETWFSGPMFNDDNTAAIGSFRLIDLRSRADVRRYIDEDPYTKADIFAAIEILRWRPLTTTRQREVTRREGTQQWLAISRLVKTVPASKFALQLTGFFEGHRDALLACGPLLSDAGDVAQANLALFIVDDREAVDQALKDDPLAGNYSETTIERWRFGHV